MHLGIRFLMFTVGMCVAHYAGFEDRDLIIREEPLIEEEGTLVECPVCENELSGLPSREVCTIVRGDKKYKRCSKGTYVNEVCGNKLDCYRGPREQCTEKMNVDAYGQKCAHGYYCDNMYHVCTGSDFNVVQSDLRWLINPGYRIHLHTRNHDHPEIKNVIRE